MVAPVEIEPGTYLMKDWEYFIELSCYNPQLIIEFITDAAKYEIIDEQSFKKSLEINFDKLKCAKSRSGLRYILSLLIQDPDKLKDYSPKTFDKILTEIDSLLSETKNRYAYEHTSSFNFSPSKKENIYHMRNWELFIDVSCVNPDYIKEALYHATKEAKGEKENSYKEMLEEFGQFFETISPEFNIISCARTREGLETMLLILLKDSLGIEIHPSFFDKVLERLDKSLDRVGYFDIMSYK